MAVAEAVPLQAVGKMITLEKLDNNNKDEVVFALFTCNKPVVDAINARLSALSKLGSGAVLIDSCLFFSF